MEWARYNTELININLIVKLSNKRGALHKGGICHTFLIKTWKVLCRLQFYSPYAQACKHFFLAETIDEAIGRFDNAKRAEAAVV